MTGDPALDWGAWHAGYDDEASGLRHRLEIVIGRIVEALNTTDRSPVRVISMCAGQARDLRGALEGVKRRDVVGRLVEVDPTLAEDARRALHSLGADQVRVHVGDAGATMAYVGAAPADIVLACGVFGNVSDTDVERTVRALPMLCARGATVIWTRHRREPDLTVEIRRWLTESGFENTAYDHVPGDSFGTVGVARFRGEPRALTDEQLFTFVREAL